MLILSMLVLSTLPSTDFFALAALSAAERHGYGIVKDIEARTRGKVRMRPGNLYRVLDRLMERGLVKARTGHETTSPPGARREYRITALGRRAVRAHLEAVVDMAEASSALSLSARRG